jgi:hypothetical protein
MQPPRRAGWGPVLVLLLWTGVSAPAAGQVSVPLSPTASAAGRSLLVPGWGQWHLGQRRGWGYALLEAGLWAAHLELRASGRDYRDQYRDVAWSNARIPSGDRVEGPWAYYEAMTEWVRSGVFDSDPTHAGIQPESDPSTFNGAKWALARGIYLPPGPAPVETDPAYQKALAYYEEHAYGAQYLWDWTGKDAALQQYRHLIDRSDQRFREASAALGAVLANHVLSAIDAYLSARGRTETGLRVAPEASAGGVRWTVSARLGSRR